MKKLLICFILASAITGCNSKTQQQSTTTATTTTTSDSTSNSVSKSKYEITCDGVGDIFLGMSVSEIEKLVGKENMQYDSVFVEGDFATMSLVIFKNKPEELIFYPQNNGELPFKNIATITTRQANSPYHFLNGIKIGMPIQEIEKLNGNVPFSFSGFDWDYGGEFRSFNKGKLEQEMPCFGGVFSYDEQIGADFDIVGDGEVKSNNSNARKAKVFVSEITIAHRE